MVCWLEIGRVDQVTTKIFLFGLSSCVAISQVQKKEKDENENQRHTRGNELK